MEKLVYVLIFFLLLLILFLIPVKIQADFEYIDCSKFRIVIIFLFGLIKLEIDSEKSTKIAGKNGKKSKIDIIDFIQFILNKGSIKYLYFRTSIGIKDPLILGIAVGVIWAIINMVFAYFFRNVPLEKIGKTDIRVEPMFERDVFEMFFSCIIRVNLVYIIIAYLRIPKIRKGGDSIARTSYRGFDANYND